MAAPETTTTTAVAHTTRGVEEEPVPYSHTAPAPYSAAPYVEEKPVERKTSHSTGSFENEKIQAQPVLDKDEPAHEEQKVSFVQKHKNPILIFTAAVILAWFISATILEVTRKKWIPNSILAWAFILIIVFRFVPTSIVSRPVEAVWMPLVQKPWYALPWAVRLGMGWLALLGIVFGSAFGFPLHEGTKYGDRAISVLGLFVFQFCFWATSSNRSAIPWPTVIVGLFLQQSIALFVLKSGAGYSLFRWIADAAADFLNQSAAGATFFFDAETVGKHWFFVNTLASIIFFIATVQMLYHIGVMGWLIENFAWVFFKIMNISGAEAVVAAASPFVGQGESACLVRPYVDLMTDSELHLTMTSGFSTIAGSVLTAYISLGVPPQNLITSSIMSIPSSIAISKMRLPETEEPVTRGQVAYDRGEEAEEDRPYNAIHAFSKGAMFGLIVAGQIYANVLTVLSLVSLIDGLLTYIGRGFGIHHLTLTLFFGYVFYPVTFLLGVPRAEILRVSQLIATKLIANEFVAYLNLKAIQASAAPLSTRAYTIASYSLCGFANVSSLGIQIGVLSALAPSRAKTIVRIALSAMICGFVSTLQSAGIAGMLT